MERYSRNILVYAVNNGNRNGFNVYLVFSGQKEYLITHRHNGAIYRILKNGIRVDDLRRSLQKMNRTSFCGQQIRIFREQRLWNSMGHLMNVIDEYVTERENCA